MEYLIQHKIHTLAQNAVARAEGGWSFEAEGIHFTQWNYSPEEGWKGDAWLATSTINASDLEKALGLYNDAISKIAPRLALIAQCYLDAFRQPLLVHRKDAKIAYFHYVASVEPVSLMFRKAHKEALAQLLQNRDVPEAFFRYWYDATNSVGYSAKLLLMLSAVEALVKKPGEKKDRAKLELILGKKMFDEFYSQKSGLRHRLVHGEHFSSTDHGTNYVEAVHGAVIRYFNTHVLQKNLLTENIVSPQRHFFGNQQIGRMFIQRQDGGTSFILHDVIDDFAVNGWNSLKRYRFVNREEDTKNY